MVTVFADTLLISKAVPDSTPDHPGQDGWESSARLPGCCRNCGEVPGGKGLRVATIVPSFPGNTFSFTYVRARALARCNLAVGLFYRAGGTWDLLNTAFLQSMLAAGVEYQALGRELPRVVKLAELGVRAAASHRIAAVRGWVRKATTEGVSVRTALGGC